MAEIKKEHIFKEFKFSDVKCGDIVQNNISGTAYVVTDVKNDRVIAVRQIEIHNESEWSVLIRK